MGLAQNLRKMLSNSASKILAELSSAFIRQRAKLITKKQDNSLQTMSSPKNLTEIPPSTIIATSSADTIEKITMANTTEEIVIELRTWAMDRFNEEMPIGDCRAIYEEFAEWIEPQGQEFEVVTLDKITEEQYDEFVDYMNDGMERG